MYIINCLSTVLLYPRCSEVVHWNGGISLQNCKLNDPKYKIIKNSDFAGC